MTELTIDRFTSTVRLPDGDGETTARVRRLADRVVDARLEKAAAKVALPQGDWCVRRVAVPLVLDLDRPEVSLEEQWAQAVIDAIGAAIDQPTSDVVHYPRRAAGLRDLVVSAAHRMVQREWAWRQIGLLAADDASPLTDPQAAVLCALRRFPRDALDALVVAVREVGVAAMHRLLGPSGWAALAVIVCAAAGCPGPTRRDTVRGRAHTPTTQPGRYPSKRRPAPRTDSAAPSTGDPSTLPRAAVVQLAEAAVARSALAAAFGSAPIRPDAAVSWDWAVLVAAESDPSILARPNPTDVVEAIAAHIDHDRDHTAPGIGLQTATTYSTPRPPCASPNQNARECVDAPDRTLIPERATLETAWAGLLFLLNTAADADIPRAILEDEILAGRPLPDVLSAVAMHIVPAAADDPAVLGLSGQLPEMHAFGALTGRESKRVARHARRWVAATVARIDDPDTEPEALLSRIVSRRGVIEAERGWLEVRLDVADVDVDVRIAGLDVDPGWVPWLGAVVRFRYV